MKQSLPSNVYARAHKARLIAALGGVCWRCGATAPTPLEIDHPEGRDWVPRKKSFSHRVSIYWREFREAKLQLLCAECNCLGLHEWYAPPPTATLPPAYERKFDLHLSQSENEPF